MINIKNQYDFGDIVYLRTDPDQLPRVIVAIEVYKDGEIQYMVKQRSTTSYHYPYELSDEKDVLLTTTG